MNWQLGYLVKEKAISSDSGVLYVDLPRNEKIAMLMLEVQLTSGAAASVVYSHSIFDAITDIQVLLEGSKTAYKASAEVGSYLAFLADGRVPPHKMSNRGTTLLKLPIHFGRYFKDEEYMLDTGKYSNAQLQISYSINTTYFTTGSLIYTVWYLRPLTNVAPRGFIRNRVVNNYTSSGSAETKYVDLPVGLPWLRVGFRCFDIDSFIYNDMTDLDLNIDQGRSHLFQGRIQDLITLQELEWGRHIPMNDMRSMAVDGDWIQTYCGKEGPVYMMDETANAVVTANDANYGPSFELRWPGVSSHETITTQAFSSLPYSGFTLLNGLWQPYPAPDHAEAQIEYTLGAYTSKLETWVQEIVEGVL